MNRNQALERRERHNSSVNLWAIIGSVALVAVAVTVVVSLPDIKRYIKISTM